MGCLRFFGGALCGLRRSTLRTKRKGCPVREAGQRQNPTKWAYIAASANILGFRLVLPYPHKACFAGFVGACVRAYCNATHCHKRQHVGDCNTLFLSRQTLLCRLCRGPLMGLSPLPLAPKRKRTSCRMSFSFWCARRDLNPHARSEH